MEFDLSQRANLVTLQEFADKIMILQNQVGFKQSARGWCYQLESERLINKNQFDKVESWINKCRKRGVLPIDFLQEEGRQFSGVEDPTEETPMEHMRGWVEAVLHTEDYYTPDWWKGEKFYIQMLVEKIDLKTLFSPVCEKYHIPIATSKGWSSMLQRATYARRFKEAEDQGLRPVLLYCGDHDPDGLRISEFIRSNLADLSEIEWEDYTSGYDPEGLEIVRFGLNSDFIEKHNLTWIDNLITGGKKHLDLSDKSHRNHYMDYVQNYLKTYGVKKCEANAIVPMPKIARELVEGTIIDFLGVDAVKRFDKKTNAIRRKVKAFRKKVGLDKALQNAIELIDKG